MVKTEKHIESKRLILLPPEQSFISQFSKKNPKRSIVLYRKKDPFVFALNEWPSYIFLRWIFFIPLVLFVIITAIPVFLFVILTHFLKGGLSDSLHDTYFEKLNFIAVNNNGHLIDESIKAYATSFSNPNKDLPFCRVLNIDITDIRLILKFDQLKIFDYVDEIWIYKSLEELYDRCISANCDLDKSYIASNSKFSADILQANESYNFVDITWLNDKNDNIVKARKNIKEKEIAYKNSLKPTPPRIKLKANNFLTPEIVYYYEPSYDSEINRFLLNNFDRINNALIAKGMRLLYIPRFLKSPGTINGELIEYASYVYPDIFNGSADNRSTLINSVIQSTDSKQLNESIKLALEFPDLDYPCFIHSVDYSDTTFEYRNFNYSVCNLSDEEDTTLEAKIEYYLQAVNISINNAYYRLIGIDEEDPDDTFARIGNKVTDELNKAITAINSLDNEKLVVASIVYIIKNLKDTQPELCENLNKVLFDTISLTDQPLSRLVIDERYRIFLSDYDNLEIELTPLPKTLFIFLLRHPEGVILKELYLHRNELMAIYGEVGNRVDMSAIQKSIYDMTSASSNSINEKCSRIKEAFISKVDDSIARNYYITGDKSEPKKIVLDRSMVLYL